jgi:hypothetical protein
LKIEWDAVNKRIKGTKEGTTLELTIGSLTAILNGKEIILQKSPRLIDGITVIPLRFVAEASGKDVNFDATTKSVSVKDKPVKPIDNVTSVTSTTYQDSASEGINIRNLTNQWSDSNKDIGSYVNIIKSR